jgi:proliferating cell nuclear antigen
MIQARLDQGIHLKKIIDSIKDLVNAANLVIAKDGIWLQAMDISHVALVSFFLKSSGFSTYICPQETIFGVSIQNLAKLLRCAGPEDVITIKGETESPSKITFIFEDECK